MGWSEWIQPADQSRTPFRTMVAFGDDLTSGIIDSVDDATFWIGMPWNAVQFRAAFSTRPAKPFPLFMLTEGVDYDAIPGSDPGDPYRFVDYEAPTETWLPWSWDNGYPEVLLTTGTPDSGSLSLVTPTDFDDVDTDPGTPGLQGGGFFSKPTGGTVFATFTGAETTGHVFGYPGEPAAADAFTILAESDGDGSGDNRIYFTFPDPVAHYRPARYRYWIPGSKVRQVNRDDGFSRTPKRARGASSRGATNRARAYD